MDVHYIHIKIQTPHCGLQSLTWSSLDHHSGLVWHSLLQSHWLSPVLQTHSVHAKLSSPQTYKRYGYWFFKYHCPKISYSSFPHGWSFSKFRSQLYKLVKRLPWSPNVMSPLLGTLKTLLCLFFYTLLITIWNNCLHSFLYIIFLLH